MGSIKVGQTMRRGLMRLRQELFNKGSKREGWSALVVSLCLGGVYGALAKGEPGAGVVVAPAVASSVQASEASKGQKLSVEDVATLQKNLKTYPFLQMKFTQKVYKDLRKKTSLSYGRAYFRKPNAFRWVLEKPSQDEWIFDGSHLWHYQPALKQAVHYGAGASKGRDLRQIVDMVINFDALLSQYKIEEAVRRGNEIALTLTPHKVGDIQSSQLVMDASNNFIKEVVLHFRGKNTTTFTFTEPSPEKLAPSLFAVPAGVKISNAL